VPTEKRQRQRDNRQLKYQQQAKQQHRATSKRRALIAVGAVVGGLAVVLGLAWVGGAFSGDDDTALAGFRYGTGECPPEEGVDEPVKSFDDAPAECIDPAASYTATFVTSMGDIVADLDTAGVPGTVNNFVTLARYGYYDDTLIFRADPSIDIIQGGGVTNSDSPGYNIPDEADGFTYEPALDAQGTYVVFGEVTEGLEIVQSIIASVSANGPPPEEVRVETVTITEGGAEEPDATTTTG
jgi:cyclophilin family peptidyl-prolyl cis-trans isomerase